MTASTTGPPGPVPGACATTTPAPAPAGAPGSVPAYGSAPAPGPVPEGPGPGSQPVPGPVPAPGGGLRLVASDLDRTLIYSAAALDLAVPDAEAPGLLCVEVYQGQPLSYLTVAAGALLEELGRVPRAIFVPATTRTPEQYLRVRLPGPAPRYAVCANGGHLLVDGVPDQGWRARVGRAVAAGCAPLAEVRKRLLAAAEPAWLLKERVVEDLFCYLVVDRARLPAGYPAEVAAWAAGRGWTASLQGRKLYAVPRPLTKSAAVAEVARRTGATETLAAGDSLLDTDLLLAADRGWRPAHGELADTGWSAPHVVALAARGVAAGEEILRALCRAAAGTGGAEGTGTTPGTGTAEGADAAAGTGPPGPRRG